jgi:hypothetical protein
MTSMSPRAPQQTGSNGTSIRVRPRGTLQNGPLQRFASRITAGCHFDQFLTDRLYLKNVTPKTLTWYRTAFHAFDQVVRHREVRLNSAQACEIGDRDAPPLVEEAVLAWFCRRLSIWPASSGGASMMAPSDRCRRHARRLRLVRSRQSGRFGRPLQDWSAAPLARPSPPRAASTLNQYAARTATVGRVRASECGRRSRRWCSWRTTSRRSTAAAGRPAWPDRLRASAKISGSALRRLLRHRTCRWDRR